MKTCTKCGATKALKEFPKLSRSKDGFRSCCKECHNFANRKYKEENSDKELAYREKNKEKYRLRASKWYYENLEKAIKRNKINSTLWRKNNPDKNAAKEAKRRSKKLKATPSWLNAEHFKQIQLEYELAAWCTKVMKEHYEVDHIVPLQGKTVCGLHVPWNLQVISRKDNRAKWNKYDTF